MKALYRRDIVMIAVLSVLYSTGDVYIVFLQHLQDILDVNMSALDWMLKAYPEVKEREDMRRIIGRYGLTGAQQVNQ